MTKYLIGYCTRCHKQTKQLKIECEDNLATRIFETVFTFGLLAMEERKYKCECTRCGEINTIVK